ncbi:hypothetical protein N3K66_007702 [Trichothecium roseum]|uniref:Uncharacterized protein n=1 Tax=Trichothecium roseum TaxID=47278 RepID=A0ACC0UUQ1_9HYPO|nr:hypothetical protein N3K66_007702 [Trichothecium roseum]
MKLSKQILLGAMTVASALAAGKDSYTYERLNKNDTLLLVVDIQEGLYELVRDFEPVTYKQAALAHSSLGPLFDLPVIMTTSAETGPNGKLMAEILAMHPDAPLIQRQGEVNAWDSAEFREAVQNSNKSQILIAGIMTDVCTAHLALSLREAGYSVWANAEASGTSSTFIRDIANDRMRSAGVNVVSLFSIVGELMGDWRNVPGAKEVFPYFDKFFPTAGTLARFHATAVTNGTIMPGQADLPY